MPRDLLAELRIAAPCHEDRSAMTAREDGKGLSCPACARTVHGVAAMTRAEVLALLDGARGERLCLELLVRDADGAVKLADGYVYPARSRGGRRLPLLAVAASMTLAACAPSSHSPGPDVVLVPPPHPEGPSPAPRGPAAPLGAVTSSGSATEEEPPAPAEPGPPAPPVGAVRAAAPPKPAPPPPGMLPVPRSHTMMRGGRG